MKKLQGNGSEELPDYGEAAFLREALRRFARRTELVTRAHGLTPRTYQLLLMLKTGRRAAGSAGLGELEERLQLGKSTVTELVLRSEDAGLVRRELDRTRRGAISVRLTPAGARRLAKVAAALGDERARLAELLQAEREATTATIRRVIRELLDARAGEDYDLYAETINPLRVKVFRTIGFDRTWARAEGQYLYDTDGDRYLDLLGGFGMFNVGRNNPRVRAALAEVLELDIAGSVQIGTSLLPGVLAERLLALTPARLAKVLFTSSGTESVEAALKLGRAATGRQRVLSAEQSFHGLTLGSLSATGDEHFTDRFGPLLPGFDRVPFGDLDALERELAHEDVALFLVEPVQGKGVNLPPAGYLEGAQGLCRRYGTLFAVDEVQTGLGRTGRMFAFEHWNLEPDLVTVAKSLSGGYVPVGALLMSQRVFDDVFDSLEHAFSHGSTFAPNDLAMAAGLATLEELERAQLVDHVRAPRHAAARADAAARGRARRRQGGARARADVGDGVRRARLREPRLARDGARPVGAVRAAGRRAALHPPPHAQPGGRARPGRPEDPAAARPHRGGRRRVRRRPRRRDPEGDAA